jgi:flagellar basal-body rod modification protein FlgD
MSSTTSIQNLQAATPLYKPRASTTSTGTTSSSGSSSTSGSMDATNIGSTFLSLLSQELQNQDPTNPVDSTAMVGQMISLNQLDQLISINQSISQAATSVSSASGAVSTGANANAAAHAITAQSTASPSTLSPAAQTSSLPFDPSTMMPWGFSNPGSSPTEVPAAASGAAYTNNLNLNSIGRN